MATRSPAMPLVVEFLRHPWVLIAVAAMLLYVGARAAADAGRAGSTVGLALAHWMPVVAFVTVAVVRGELASALAVLMASSVACLSLVPGATLLQQSREASAGVSPGASPRGASAAGWLLPAVAVLIFLAGIRGQYTWFHAAALLIIGGSTAVCLRESPTAAERKEGRGVQGEASRGRSAGPRVVQFVLAVGIVAAGGIVALLAAKRAAEASAWASLPLVSAVLIAPLLVLSLLGVSADLASRGRTATALDAQRGVLLLNLCLLLPVVIVAAHVRQLTHDSAAAAAAVATPITVSTTSPTTAPTAVDPDDAAPAWPTVALPFPMGLWRVDAVALVILSLFFLPAAQGKWALSRADGAGLVAGYLAYLLLTLITQLDLPPIVEILKLLFHLPSHGG